MNTATSDTGTLDEADRYLREVAPHLAGMPAEERADLLEDLAQHLREIAAEPGPPLAERLGSPKAYAAELLASAGVTAAAQPHPPLLARAGELVDRVRESWAGREATSMAPILRPAWWVIRAYLAVSLLASAGASDGFPVPRLADSQVVGLLGVFLAIPLSVRLGRRTPSRSGRLAVIGANLVLILYALTLLDGPGTQIRYVAFGSGPGSRRCLVTGAGEPITNLYAYDADGRLLDPVLLYDQNGRPVDNLCPEVDSLGRRLITQYRPDVNGAPAINAFPRRQSAIMQPSRPLSRPGQPDMTVLPEITVPVKPPAVVVPRLTPATTVTPTTSAGG